MFYEIAFEVLWYNKKHPIEVHKSLTLRCTLNFVTVDLTIPSLLTCFQTKEYLQLFFDWLTTCTVSLKS